MSYDVDEEVKEPEVEGGESVAVDQELELRPDVIDDVVRDPPSGFIEGRSGREDRLDRDDLSECVRPIESRSCATPDGLASGSGDSSSSDLEMGRPCCFTRRCLFKASFRVNPI